MVIPVYVVSEGKALYDWIYWSRDEPRGLGAKIQNPVRHILTDVPWGVDVKSSLKDNLKIPDIFFSATVNPLNSTLYTGRIS